MQPVQHLVHTIFGVLLNGLMFLRPWFRRSAAAAENLFLRKQLGLFVERKVKPRRATDSIRFTLGQLSRWFDWREALIVVQRETLTRWHRKTIELLSGVRQVCERRRWPAAVEKRCGCWSQSRHYV